MQAVNSRTTRTSVRKGDYLKLGNCKYSCWNGGEINSGAQRIRGSAFNYRRDGIVSDTYFDFCRGISSCIFNGRWQETEHSHVLDWRLNFTVNFVAPFNSVAGYRCLHIGVFVPLHLIHGM